MWQNKALIFKNIFKFIFFSYAASKLPKSVLMFIVKSLLTFLFPKRNSKKYLIFCHLVSNLPEAPLAVLISYVNSVHLKIN